MFEDQETSLKTMEKVVNSMRRIVIKKVMIDNIESAWTEGLGRSFVLFKVDHEQHTIQFDYEGRDVPARDFWDLCLSDPDIREEIKWAIFKSHRVNPATVTIYNGESGCADYSIRVHHCLPENMGFFKGCVANMLHVSCVEMVAPRFRWWAGDLAPVLFAMHTFKLTQNAAFDAAFDKDVIIKFRGKYINPKNEENITHTDVNDILNVMRNMSSSAANSVKEFKPRRERRPRRAIDFPEIEPVETFE